MLLPSLKSRVHWVRRWASASEAVVEEEEEGLTVRRAGMAITEREAIAPLRSMDVVVEKSMSGVAVAVAVVVVRSIFRLFFFLMEGAYVGIDDFVFF